MSDTNVFLINKARIISHTNIFHTSKLLSGALGARLTGAGWGGCIVSLVETDKLDKFKSYLNKNYYASIPRVPLNHLFTTSPSQGLTVLKVVNEE